MVMMRELNSATVAGKHDDKTGKNQITVEGHGLKIFISTDGMVGTTAKSSSITEIKEVLGIEAARYNN